MKLLKKYLLLSLVALLLSFTNATAEGGEVVIIKVQEACNGCSKKLAKMIITENSTTKEVELLTGFNSPDTNKNSETISIALNQYIKAGYKIESSTSEVLEQPHTVVRTTYILTK